MRILLLNYHYLVVIIVIINNLFLVFCQQQDQRTYRELIKEPIAFALNDNRIINHFELPSVKDELSITLKINIVSHGLNWTTVFHKGRTTLSERTPSLWLTPNGSSPHPRFSVTGNGDYGASVYPDGLLLNRWYHIAYTLSVREKRMDLYIDGKWIQYISIILVQNQDVVFNDAPLYIGRDPFYDGITGQMSNFRYYNFHLTPKEVLMDYSGEDPIKSNKTTTSPSNAGDNCSRITITTGGITDGILAGSIIGSFLGGIIFLAGCLFLHKNLKRNTIDEGVINN